MAGQLGRESVSALSVIQFLSSFNLLKEPVESERQPSCLCALWEGLELPSRTTRGGGKQRMINREGDEIQDEEKWSGRTKRRVGRVCVLFTSRHASGLQVR